MRKQFAKALVEEMSSNDRHVLITADMGYGLWDTVRDQFPNRFFNVGSAEQLMIGCAAGFAMEGKIPICYSITPFAIYRPFEFIRNFMNHEVLPIKIVGGGRNRDYGYLGFTHWAEEDIDVLSNFKNISLYKPKDETELDECVFNFLYDETPAYINLIK